MISDVQVEQHTSNLHDRVTQYHVLWGRKWSDFKMAAQVFFFFFIFVI